ncbi:uncharacterized protein isoform X2 [Macaca fascicularis]|uniref:uncharacterized protein isoform X2 n=1 Tax=Macaca fascicularis TaxID=9541 RepID=UPI0032B06A36
MKSSSVTAKEIKENQGPKWFPWVEHFAAFRRTSAHVVSSSAAAAHLISFLLVLAWGPPARTLPGLRVGAVFSPRRRESRGRKLARSGGACPPSPARLGGPRRWTLLGCSSSAVPPRRGLLRTSRVSGLGFSLRGGGGRGSGCREGLIVLPAALTSFSAFHPRPGRFRMQMRAAFVAVRLSGSRAFVWGEITAKGFCLAF